MCLGSFALALRAPRSPSLQGSRAPRDRRAQTSIGPLRSRHSRLERDVPTPGRFPLCVQFLPKACARVLGADSAFGSHHSLTSALLFFCSLSPWSVSVLPRGEGFRQTKELWAIRRLLFAEPEATFVFLLLSPLSTLPRVAVSGQKKTKKAVRRLSARRPPLIGP